MNPKTKSRLVALAAAFLPAVMLIFDAQTIQAASATWNLNPVSGDWNTPSNWTPATVPNGFPDSATFASSNTTGVALSANTSVIDIGFNAGASPFTITVPSTFRLNVGDLPPPSTQGIINSSGIPQNFVTANGLGSGGTIWFLGNATAGINTAFTNNGGAINGEFPGQIVFFLAAKAGSGIFTNNGGTVSGGGGGGVTFREGSTAGSGTFINNGGTVSGAGGGGTVFDQGATAGNSTLIANGGLSGGNGGRILFQLSSTGGTARAKVFDNGNLDISNRSPGITIGSIEGTGIVFLGSRLLTVGSNNLSTALSGVIRDGGFAGGTGGSLTKIGSGTLRLSGANTYTGNTIVSAGRLLTNNSTGSGTSSGAVTVNNSGSVLGGTGTIAGPVTVSSGAALLGGDATAANGSLKVANNLTLNSGSIIELVLGASGAHSTLTRTGGSWTFAPNQRFTFIDVGAQPGLYASIITGLAAAPEGTASWTITNAGFAGTFTYDGAGNIDLNLTAATGPALQLTGAVSRKTHAAAGDFDIPLPLTGQPGVECRSSGGSYTLVLSFNNSVVSGNASVTSGTASVTGSSTFAGNTMTVNLTGVTNEQVVTVTLDNVTDSFSQVFPDTTLSAGFLIGDTDGDHFVNAGDALQTRNRSGQASDATTFRSDVNIDGFVNSGDTTVVRSRSGTALP